MKFNFNDEQIKLLRKITDIEVTKDLTDAEELKIYASVEDYLIMNCFDKNDNPLAEAYICEDILALFV